MPSCLTHFTFTDSLCKKDDPYRMLTDLGGQGPDIFFFYGYSVHKRPDKKSVRDFGTEVHHIDLSDLYDAFITYAQKKEGPERDALFAYIRGLFTHYALDRNCHPYIFYRTGFGKTPEEEHYYMYSHVKFEAYLDSLICKKFGTDPNGVRAIAAPKEQVCLVSKMWCEVGSRLLKAAYIKEDSYYEAWRDMRFIERLLYSRYGGKRALYGAFLRKSQLYAMCSPVKVKEDEKIDFLNEKKSPWADAVTGAVRNESFLELMDKARKDVARADVILEKARKGEDVLGLIRDFAHGTDHDGFPVGAEKVHFDFCWNKVLPEGKRLV